jgi:hypothetical protein
MLLHVRFEFKPNTQCQNDHVFTKATCARTLCVIFFRGYVPLLSSLEWCIYSTLPLVRYQAYMIPERKEKRMHRGMMRRN